MTVWPVVPVSVPMSVVAVTVVVVTVPVSAVTVTVFAVVMSTMTVIHGAIEERVAVSVTYKRQETRVRFYGAEVTEAGF